MQSTEGANRSTCHPWRGPVRTAASLFDVSHMGQLRLVGPDAAAAFETLIPVDVQGLAVGKQRYGMLLNETGGILDDLMFVNRGTDIFVSGTRRRTSSVSSPAAATPAKMASRFPCTRCRPRRWPTCCWRSRR